MEQVVATSSGGLSHENGPLLYTEPNRTSAIDDIRSAIIYIFIITIFLSFFLILPGIRSEKFPTFLCITTSLLVTSIIIISLFGTTWHVAEAPISAAYKAFSRDRIQGELKVNIGLQSVNITLKAHRYYILHATDGPIIMENNPPATMITLLNPKPNAAAAATTTTYQHQTTHSNHLDANIYTNSDTTQENSSSSSSSSFFTNQPDSSQASSFINQGEPFSEATTNVDNVGGGVSVSKAASNLAEDLVGRTQDGLTEDAESEVDEVFANREASNRWIRSSEASKEANVNKQRQQQHHQAPQNTETQGDEIQKVKKRSTSETTIDQNSSGIERTSGQLENPLNRRPATSPVKTKYTIKRVNVDINYNERFYWIGPNQMRQEYHSALERGLPYPILTVVEYLSQDDAGFNWSRQYRAAGYYSSIVLWLAVCVCILMFCLHCAAPKYGIYTMQILGCLLLFTDLIYYSLVPKGEQKLVIPFEGRSLSFNFGWNFWLVLLGGFISLIVGTSFVVIDYLKPNYIFTTILDHDFDSKYYRKRKVLGQGQQLVKTMSAKNDIVTFERPKLPAFYSKSNQSSSERDFDDEDDDDFSNQEDEVQKIAKSDKLSSSTHATKVRHDETRQADASTTSVISSQVDSDRATLNEGASIVDIPKSSDYDNRTLPEGRPHKQRHVTKLVNLSHQQHRGRRRPNDGPPPDSNTDSNINQDHNIRL